MSKCTPNNAAVHSGRRQIDIDLTTQAIMIENENSKTKFSERTRDPNLTSDIALILKKIVTASEDDEHIIDEQARVTSVFQCNKKR
jgi:hypothetical protein